MQKPRSMQSRRMSAAVNKAKYANQFIGNEAQHVEVHGIGHTGMSSRAGQREKAPHHLKVDMDDNSFMNEQLHAARNKQKTESSSFTKIPTEFMALLDVDGDGTIDQEEYQLMEELENVVGEDLDGDGVIDEAETKLARIRAGRRLLAKKFVDRQQGKMFRFGPEFINCTPQQCTNMICKAKYFAGLMNNLKYQERQLRLSSSDQVRNLMTPPLSHRSHTGRYCDLSDTMTANISYKVPKKLLTSKKGATAAQMQQARTRNDILFSARKNRTSEFNHSRGAIQGYGNFTNYLDKTIEIYGSFKVPK